MSIVTDEQARDYIYKLLAAISKAGASDLFIANDFPPSMKVYGSMQPVTSEKLTGDMTRRLANAMMNERQREEFEREMECNFAVSVPGLSRFRVNVLIQQQSVGMVFRTIPAEIPSVEKLGLPDNLKEIVMLKRGLVLVVGATGSGKSTSLAAMIDHRNQTSAGHIITVEDPVEFVHKSSRSLITHREVGVDTRSWHHALKNTLRQAPDVILIGEIRDAETMEHAIAFAETGHLCLGTLHANNSSQALDRIVNFFPDERRKQLLMDLSSNLRSIISQRLIPREDGKGRKAAIEILLNTPTVADRIFAGEFNEILSIMEKSRELGMRTFDWSLFGLYNEGHISYEEAIANAESANGLRLNIKLRSQRGEPTAGLTGLNLALHEVKDSPEADEQAVREEEMRRQAETRRKRLEQLHQERQKQLQSRHRREDEHLEILRKHHVPGEAPPTKVKPELSLMPDPTPPTRPPSQELSLAE